MESRSPAAILFGRVLLASERREVVVLLRSVRYNVSTRVELANCPYAPPQMQEGARARLQERQAPVAKSRGVRHSSAHDSLRQDFVEVGSVGRVRARIA